MNPKKLVLYPVLAIAFPLVACISTESDLVSGATQGSSCDTYTTAQLDADGEVDPQVKIFAKASIELRDVSLKMKGSVKDACIKVAGDLGVADTWSNAGDDDAVVTKACDAAIAKVVEIMKTQRTVGLALSITRGECHPDFEAQVQCEAGCKAQEKCEPGTVETRCEPAELSVKCDASCKASACCEGTAQVKANCDGKCESTCEGKCEGTCTDATGKKTEGDANCKGKCTARCVGSCHGRCTIEASAGINCGAEVSCKGGCEGSYHEPKCTTEFLPPKCTIDERCFASCRASAATKAVCEPTTVEVFAATGSDPQVAKLVATLKANLPIIIDAAEAQGKIALSVSEKLIASAEAVVSSVADLNGKSLGCVKAASTSLKDTTAHIKVSGTASAKFVDECQKNAD